MNDAGWGYFETDSDSIACNLVQTTVWMQPHTRCVSFMSTVSGGVQLKQDVNKVNI